MTQFTLPKIPEIDPGQPTFKITKLTTIERKISNASYHKRHRGLCNKKVKYCAMMRQQIALFGLQQCEIIQSDSGTTHNITDKKDSLMHFKSITPLPVAGIQKRDTTLCATSLGYLTLTSKEITTRTGSTFVKTFSNN